MPTTILWRPQLNVLTNPPSYRIQYVPRQTEGYAEMAADIAAEYSLYSEETISGLAPLIMKWIQQRITNGSQVTFQDAFTFRPSFSGKLDSPDDPLPESDDLLQLNVYPSRPFIREIRHKAKFERLPLTEKLPVISAAEDTKLKLADVLFAGGVLKLIGSNLNFNEENPACGCLIEGTRSGQQKQSVYASVANSEILVVPNIPEQDAPWNNEYMVTLTTQYSEHGTLRSGTYSRKLRTPIAWDGLEHEGGTGILTGNADMPYVTVESGTVAADEMLRIQSAYDAQSGGLTLNLLGMKESGSPGALVPVAADGTYTLPGFSGSGVTSIVIEVAMYSELFSLVRNSYSGRLVDILDIRLT